MAINDVRQEQESNHSWFDIPFVMTLAKKPTKLEEAAKTIASKLEGEQDNVLNLVEQKIESDMAKLSIWVARMQDQEAMVQGSARGRKLALKQAAKEAVKNWVDRIFLFKEQADVNLAGVIAAKNSAVQDLCMNPLSGKNGASSIIVVDMNAVDAGGMRAKLTAAFTLVTGNETRDIAVVLLPWDRDLSFSSQVVCLCPTLGVVCVHVRPCEHMHVAWGVEDPCLVCKNRPVRLLTWFENLLSFKPCLKMV
jgi:hypothetical protein